MEKKKRILWVTDDSWQPTGYGMVTRNILRRLVKDYNYEVFALGCQHSGGAIKLEEGYTVLPRRSDKDGFDILYAYLKAYKPDAVLTLRDIGLQVGYFQAINKARKEGWKGRWYGYCPVDSKTIAFTWDKFFKMMDMPIAMSEWGARMMKEQVNQDSIVIPHGVDTEVFKPLTEEEREKLRAKEAYGSTFTIGSGGRNKYRKMWNTLIRGFGQFSKDKTGVSLLLHSDMRPASASDGWDVRYLGQKYGCLKKIAFTYPSLDMVTRFFIDDKTMNEVYNKMDIFCFPTGGEGFGVPLIEAQAAGLPVATTAFTTGFELVEGHGELIKVLKDHKGRDVTWEGQNGVEFAIPDWDDIQEKIQKLYSDKALREKYSKASREFAVKNYDWKVILPMWDKLFSELPSQHK